MKTKFELRQEKIALREAKKAEREEKKAARAEKQRIAKLPAKKATPQLIKNVISKIDPDSKFSAQKVKALSKRIKQLAELKPAVVANRLRARKAQVDMIAAIFEEIS